LSKEKTAEIDVAKLVAAQTAKQNAVEDHLAEVRLRTHASELGSLNRKLEKELHKRDGIIEHLLGLEGYEPAHINIKERKRKGKANATPMIQASDWHIGERVDPSTCGFRNEYKPEIAQERAERYFQNSLRLVNHMRAGAAISDLVFWIGGDIINGYIHDEFIEDNYMSPTQETLFGYDLLTSGIDFLLAKGDFKKIFIPTSQGNHGRTGQKYMIATAYKNSYEWMLYHMLRKHYENEKRVEFQITNGYHNRFDVAGTKVRAHHGDAIRYKDGVGGLNIPINKAIMAWNKIEVVNFDIMGHWHQWLPGLDKQVNGSLIGWNAFAVQIKASYEEPSQAFTLIDHERGPSIRCPIWVK